MSVTHGKRPGVHTYWRQLCYLSGNKGKTEALMLNQQVFPQPPTHPLTPRIYCKKKFPIVRGVAKKVAFWGCRTLFCADLGVWEEHISRTLAGDVWLEGRWWEVAALRHTAPLASPVPPSLPTLNSQGRMANLKHHTCQQRWWFLLPCFLACSQGHHLPLLALTWLLTPSLSFVFLLLHRHFGTITERTLEETQHPNPKTSQTPPMLTSHHINLVLWAQNGALTSSTIRQHAPNKPWQPPLLTNDQQMSHIPDNCSQQSSLPSSTAILEKTRDSRRNPTP